MAINKKKLAQERQRIAKRRAKYRRITGHYKDVRRAGGTDYPDNEEDVFKCKGLNQMIEELCLLNLKTIQVLWSDLLQGEHIHPWRGHYRAALVSAIESNILERTILK